MGTTYDNAYIEMKVKLHAKALSLGIAFSERQLNEMTDKFGLTENDFERVIFLNRVCYIRKCEHDAFYKILDNFEKEKQQAIANDATGYGFIRDMFYNELCMNNYRLTWSLHNTLLSLGLTLEQVKADKRLLRGLKSAVAAYRQKCNEYLSLLEV